MSPSSTILFAGGGSGGHISPGLAIAEHLRDVDQRVRTMFACSTRRIDQTMLEEAKMAYQSLDAAPLSVRPRGLIRFLRGFRTAKRQGVDLIKRESVDVVVSLGGFVAAPTVAAACKCGVNVLLVNLDASPGKANRWIARRSTVILSAVPTPALPDFAERIVGMPIRRCSIAPGDARSCRLQLGLDPSLSTLLITGASQGATSLNRFMLAVTEQQPAWLHGRQVLHLAGRGDVDTLRAAYANAEIPAIVEPFVHTMGLAWGAADLALSRAGASSVAEAYANAVPTIFLPYPYHRDQHQRHNAQPLVQLGGAVVAEDMIDPEQNLKSLDRTFRELLDDVTRRTRMCEAMKTHAPPKAAELIARQVMQLATTTSSFE